MIRRDILARAIEREQSVSALARRYEMSLTAVQKHVAVLERAALVCKQSSGREQRVAADPETLRKAAICSLPSSSCGFNRLAGDDGEPVPGLEPVDGVVTFEPIATGTRMTVLCQFADAEQMEQLAMGMQEGMSIAIGQIDALLEVENFCAAVAGECAPEISAYETLHNLGVMDELAAAARLPNYQVEARGSGHR